jgi:uncharacterized protein YndB with AHSA1/START domain
MKSRDFRAIKEKSMKRELKLVISIDIKARPEDIWFALTDEEMVANFFWGAQIDSDWEKDSLITFSGSSDGIAYEDKGIILEIEPAKKLKYSYWSSLTEVWCDPDDFSIVTYDIEKKYNSCTLNVTQEGFVDEYARDEARKYWEEILAGIKKLLEGMKRERGKWHHAAKMREEEFEQRL